MNIKELLDWREKCFFCQEELVIVPTLGILSVTFKIEDDWMHVKSDSNQIQLYINIVTGLIKEVEPSVKITVEELFKRINFKMTFECQNCINGSGRLYDYKGRISFFNDNIAKVVMLNENVHLFDKWIFSQHKKFLKNEEYGEIISWKMLNTDQSISNKQSVNNNGAAIAPVKTPFIDLNQTTPEKLDSKLKTLMIFS